ncbi:MAG: DUF4286 family protein [Bacteroidaceae bacterium]
MLVYNTTFQMEEDMERNFIIWINECYIPEVQKVGLLTSPRLCRILSHQEEGNSCFSLQWEVESSGILHRWHMQQGALLNEQLIKIFKDKVVGFPTLMEVME